MFTVLRHDVFLTNCCLQSPARYSPGASLLFQICTDGYYCAEGAAAALPCPGGTTKKLGVVMMAKKDCDVCGEGTFCPVGSGAATNCSAGTFNDQPGQGSCLKCVAGDFQDAEGATGCKVKDWHRLVLENLNHRLCATHLSPLIASLLGQTACCTLQSTDIRAASRCSTAALLLHFLPPSFTTNRNCTVLSWRITAHCVLHTAKALVVHAALRRGTHKLPLTSHSSLCLLHLVTRPDLHRRLLLC